MQNAFVLIDSLDRSHCMFYVHLQSMKQLGRKRVVAAFLQFLFRPYFRHTHMDISLYPNIIALISVSFREIIEMFMEGE